MTSLLVRLAAVVAGAALATVAWRKTQDPDSDWSFKPRRDDPPRPDPLHAETDDGRGARSAVDDAPEAPATEPPEDTSANVEPAPPDASTDAEPAPPADAPEADVQPEAPDAASDAEPEEAAAAEPDAAAEPAAGATTDPAVVAANTLDAEALAALGITARGVKVLLDGRPFADRETLEATRGVGPKTLEALSGPADDSLPAAS